MYLRKFETQPQCLSCVGPQPAHLVEVESMDLQWILFETFSTVKRLKTKQLLLISEMYNLM